jgi:hypothetical protein
MVENGFNDNKFTGLYDLNSSKIVGRSLLVFLKFDKAVLQVKCDKAVLHALWVSRCGWQQAKQRDRNSSNANESHICARNAFDPAKFAQSLRKSGDPLANQTAHYTLLRGGHRGE